MIPIYTMATGSSPVFVDNYDGVPGEKIAINVPWPANTGRFLGTKWDTGDSLFWVSKSVPGSSEVGHIEITGYFPMEIPDGARSIYVLFTES